MSDLDPLSDEIESTRVKAAPGSLSQGIKDTESALEEDDWATDKAGRLALVKRGLGSLGGLVSQGGSLAAQGAGALARGAGPALGWLAGVAGRTPAAVGQAAKAVTSMIPGLGGKSAKDREEAELLAESGGDENDDLSPKPTSAAGNRVKLAVAGSVAVLAAAPFVAKYVPGGGKNTVPALAVTGPVKGSQAKPGTPEKTGDSEKPAAIQPPAQAADAAEMFAGQGAVLAGSKAQPHDPFAVDEPNPPLPVEAVGELISQDAPQLGAASLSNTPELDATPANPKEGTGLAMPDPKGVVAAEPPDPFSPNTAASGIERVDEAKALAPKGVEILSPVVSKPEDLSPAPLEAASGPALAGLAALAAMDEEKTEKSDEKPEPLEGPIGSTEMPIHTGVEPVIIPEPEPQLPVPKEQVPPEPVPSTEPPAPQIKNPEPFEPLANEPPVPVQVPEAVPSPLVPRGAIAGGASKGGSAIAIGSATAAGVVAGAAIEGSSGTPPKKVTSVARSEGGASTAVPPSVVSTSTPAADTATVTAIPPQKITSVPRNGTADSIKLQAPPADSPAMASNPGVSQPSVTVPEPSDPSLFVPLEKARSGAGRDDVASSKSSSDVVGGRIDPITHVVRRGENFWTISKHYYGSGRFYKALWRANSARVPQIEELYIGTKIQVPAPEDLDSRFIEPASGASGSDRKSSPSSRSNETFSDTQRANPRSAQLAPRDNQTERTGRNATPVRESDPDDLFSPAEEPTSRAPSSGRRIPSSDEIPPEAPMQRTTRDDFGSDPSSKPRPAQVADDPVAAVSLAPRANSRNTTTDNGDTPRPRKARVHVVRPYETLRSIAKKELGDSRREGELLELNSDLIDDPDQLSEGTPLRLPSR